MNFSLCASHAEDSTWIISLSHKKPSEAGFIIFILCILKSHAERLSHSTRKSELGFSPHLSLSQCQESDCTNKEPRVAELSSTVSDGSCFL